MCRKRRNGDWVEKEVRRWLRPLKVFHRKMNPMNKRLQIGQTEESRHSKPPLWILLATLFSIPLWLFGTYWLKNSYSGWDELASKYPAENQLLIGSLGPTSVSVIDPSGRRWECDSITGQRRFKECEVGFDSSGFWVRSRGSGWLSGPAKAAYFPWRSVGNCANLTIKLTGGFSLTIADQQLLDMCKQMKR